MSSIVDIFAWTWNFWGGCGTRKKSNLQKMAAFSEDFLSEDDIEAFLAPFCCDDYGVNSFSVN